MKVDIFSSVGRGSVALPTSKSIAHRVLICSAFCCGTTVIDNLNLCDDVTATVNCLRTIGADIKISGNCATVNGITDYSSLDNKRKLFVGESGSTLRFLMPIVLALGGETEIICEGNLINRPIDEYIKICKDNGIDITAEGNKIKLCGKLSQKEFFISGEKSSQFVTGLLLSSNILETVKITVDGFLASKNYVDLTLRVLENFGFSATKTGSVFSVRKGGSINNKSVLLPTDMSQSAYFEALKLLNGEIGYNDFTFDSLQPDSIAAEYLCRIKAGDCTLDVSCCPDLAPLLMAFASLFSGVTLVGTENLIYKESNRAVCMADELNKCGVVVQIHDNRLSVSGGASTPYKMLSSHGDHRIAMSLAVLLTMLSGTIDRAEAVSKSYPAFFEDLQNAGYNIKIIN